MDVRTLYKTCTFLGTLIFILIFVNYYLEAKEEERSSKQKEGETQKNDDEKKSKRGKSGNN